MVFKYGCVVLCMECKCEMKWGWESDYKESERVIELSLIHIFVYLDDVIVIGKIFKDHFKTLRSF